MYVAVKNELDLWYLSITNVSLGKTYLANTMILALTVIESERFKIFPMQIH